MYDRLAASYWYTSESFSPTGQFADKSLTGNRYDTRSTVDGTGMNITEEEDLVFVYTCRPST